MKKFILIAVALGIFLNWNTLRDEFSPPPDFSAQHPEGVVLYATEWCGYCKKAREFFKQNNIAYVKYDIEKSAEVARNTVAVGLAPRHLAFQSPSQVTAHDLNKHVLTKAEIRDVSTEIQGVISSDTI